MQNSDNASRPGGRRKGTTPAATGGETGGRGLAGLGRRRAGLGPKGLAGVARRRRAAEEEAGEDRLPESGDRVPSESFDDRETAPDPAAAPDQDVPSGTAPETDQDQPLPPYPAAQAPDPVREPEPSRDSALPARAQPPQGEHTAAPPAEDAPGDEAPGRPGGGGRRWRNRLAAGTAQPEPKVVFIPPPTVPSARPRRRHWAILFSFFLLVLAPFAISAWYLYERATDQYASTLGFSVHREGSTSNFEDVGSIFGMGQQSASDTEVLYEFIQSQDMVERIDARLDLRSIYLKAPGDPVFAIAPGAAIEDLVDYWRRMVTIFYDAGSGLMEVRVLAFDPVDAQAISRAIFEESSEMINALSAIAREDSINYAREDLERAEAQVREARAALTKFRADNQIVDPGSRIQIDLGLLGALNTQLAQAEIELALLQQTAREGDPRLRPLEQRIEVIQGQIAEEQAKFGIGRTEGGSAAYATLVGEFEGLSADVLFAENAYEAARTNYAAALAEATRQSRYLAPHIRPTLAQSAEYPRREVILLVMGLILFMSWSSGVMIYYSVKDRR